MVEENNETQEILIYVDFITNSEKTLWNLGFMS